MADAPGANLPIPRRGRDRDAHPTIKDHKASARPKAHITNPSDSDCACR
jgi:hypothetical protein